MSTLVRKVCMVGEFAVGKTSLVARFVHSTFSEVYLSTVGVKVDTRTLRLPAGPEVKLVLWDIAGAATLGTVERHYLQGAAGLVLVADGTRAATLQGALALHRQACDLLGPRPTVLLLNKHDLQAQWELDAAPAAPGLDAFNCSARTGAGVETAFARLAAALAQP